MASSRRDFLKTAGAGAIALAAPTIAQQSAALPKSDVYIGKGSAAEVLPKLFEKMGGIQRFVKSGARVLIKPNMSFANPPEWATGTSPEAVYTVAKLCLDAGAKRVIVCDNTLRDPDLCKEKTGIGAALKDLKGVVIFVPKENNLFVTVSNEKATALRTTDIVNEVTTADTFISLPCAKSHSAAGVSLNIKGLMGLINNRGVLHREMDLHTAIAELLYYLKPHVSIVDATRALLDNGPGGPGKVLELNTFVAGTDPVAVDSCAVTLAQWYGKKFEGKNVQHLRIAAELGFGNVDPDRITVTTV